MRFILLFSLATIALTPAAAQKPNDNGVDPTEIALESLFTMEVTTASKFPEKLSEAPGVMSVVTQDELRRYGAMTLREALERVPGLVAATSYFTDRSMVAVRGDQIRGNGSHILILINGRPTREVLDGGIVSDLMQSFPVNILERIEVIRGPGSVMYGSTAFSGVINLITKKALGRSATFRTYAAGAGAGGASGEFLLERGKLNVVAAGQARFDPTWRGGYQFAGTEPAPGVRPGFQTPSVRDRGPGAFVGVNYKGLRFMGAYSEWQSGYFVTGTVGENRWRRGFSNVGYTFAPSAKWDMSFDLTHTLTRLSSSDVPDIKAASSDTVLEWTNVLRPSSRDQITFGTLYNYVEGNALYTGVSPAISVLQDTRNAAGLYAQIEHRLSDEVKLIGGFQSNKIGPLNLDTVPRAGLVWSPASHVHVKALYGKAFRAPSLTETSINHPGILGIPTLRPEQMGTLDLGISFQANRFLAAANFFDSRQTDIIVVDASRARGQYSNLGAVTGRGVEFEGKYYLGDNLFVHGSLLYNTHGSVPVPTPHWTASGGASYQARKAFTLSLFDVYHTAVPGFQARINPAPAAYHLINMHSRLELSRVFGNWAKGLALFAHGVNLANREIWLPDTATPTADTIPFRRGRTLYYGIEVALFRE